MIFYFLWRAGLLARADREKIGFFLGAGSGEYSLSRRAPLVASIHWIRALFDPRYAKAVVSWLTYRADLYDGHQG